MEILGIRRLAWAFGFTAISQLMVMDVNGDVVANGVADVKGFLVGFHGATGSLFAWL